MIKIIEVERPERDVPSCYDSLGVYRGYRDGWLVPVWAYWLPVAFVAGFAFAEVVR